VRENIAYDEAPKRKSEMNPFSNGKKILKEKSMKQTLKLFLLGLLTAGAMTGCDKAKEEATTTTAAQTAARAPPLRGIQLG